MIKRSKDSIIPSAETTGDPKTKTRAEHSPPADKDANHEPAITDEPDDMPT
jgi:hypothetical protein